MEKSIKMTNLERGISMKDALTPSRLGGILAQNAAERGDMLQASALYVTGYASSVLTWALPVALVTGAIIAGGILGYAALKDDSRVQRYDFNPTSCYASTEKEEIRRSKNDLKYKCP